MQERRPELTTPSPRSRVCSPAQFSEYYLAEFSRALWNDDWTVWNWSRRCLHKSKPNGPG
jgi:hypothetical protein